MFFIINVIYSVSVEQNCLNKINKYRAMNGRSPLNMNQQLVEAAKVQSIHQTQIRKCAHEGPAGEKDILTRIKNKGYSPSAYGENVAQGNRKSSKEAFKLWKTSPPHNENMLSPEYDETGLACVISNEGRSYWTQVFAKNSGNNGSKPKSKKKMASPYH